MASNLGFILFFGIAFMAFWMLIFLFTVAVPYWVQLGVQSKVAERAKKKAME